ncbi:hypothetical protein Vadar_024280 [Vaccinium darrowii]|uniref:Uncharacterized protein n=1 Tax=Vaccinium darrowii TaxID=229202 RepID=A0ACB7XJN5_9ERIC|nr:hypothetical protein Vadar_024280 [Vaccinium darrowii]
MGVYSILAFIAASHMLILHSTGKDTISLNYCPSYLDCGTHGPIKFPFTDTRHPHCGLCTVRRCDEPVPKVTLGQGGRSYEVSAFSDDSIQVKDPILEKLINEKNCDFSSFLNLSSTPSISYTISPNLTLLKCMTNNVELQLQTAKYFRDNSNYSSYKGCHNYTVFYSYPNPPVQVPTQGSYPPNCAAFQLPLVSPFAEQNLEDPFSLLASDYSITFHVSEECQACRLKGSQCPLDSQEFLCLKKRGAVTIVGITIILLFFIVIKKLAQSESILFWRTMTEDYRNIEAFLKNCGALIYEFMPNGSLDKFINDGGSATYCQLGWDALYQIAVGIARGLEYLHRGCNTQILHFDITPHNILLNEDFRPKIADFGLAKLCPQKESIISLVGARGTAGYIAPEVFSRNFGGVSHKSDVYSYGMMVLEMVGARKNTSVEVDRTSEIYFPHWVYKRLELDEELELHGVVDDKANGTVRKMIIVGLWCIQIDPSHRPSISRVVEMLEGSLESLQIPPKPFLSFPSISSVDSPTTLMP